MDDLTLTLGGITFKGVEIPERINWGGEQMLVVHKLVGGQKTVDSMGPDEAPIEWSGWITGQDAVARAQSIDAMRISGLPQTLTWSGFSYQVVVRSFAPSFERFYQIPYRITLEVISNNVQPNTASETPPLDQAVADDVNTATDLASQAADSTLSSLMGNVSSLIGGVASIATAAQSTIGAIQTSIQSVQSRVGNLIESVNAVIGIPASFGGVTAGMEPSASANALLASVDNTMRLVNLMQLQPTLGRLTKNLSAVSASANTIATAGGNLFQIAQETYGDANAWPVIAAANGLTDPFIQGSETLIIPPQPGATGGILSP